MCNVGGIDRWLRLIIGLIVIGIGYYLGKNWIVMAIGAILFLTGVFGFAYYIKFWEFQHAPIKSRTPDFW